MLKLLDFVRNNIPESEFPFYVREMNENGSERLKQEYMVRIPVLGIFCWILCFLFMCWSLPFCVH